ncbi:MAG: LemA family protein [Candidatus Parcubacteria bacterium]|nr:LemA family protein [Patescibacteria group bacterium]BCX16095.1 MAG: LemA family protein [Candidatus Parcubacteria bacterium]
MNILGFLSSNFIWIILVLVVGWLILTYNSLVRTRNRVREGWSDIEVQLKRRHDLIPNLVNTVKGYMAHERTVFENVTQARARALGAQNKQERAEAEGELSNTLKTLFAVAENYPELKANANFLDLQREIADTENKIQAARRFYNSMVLELNTKIQVFPTNLIARLLGFKEEEFFKAEEEEKENVKVEF